MTPLPIDSFLPSIVEALRVRSSLVLVAPPGAGKTTRVPPAILEAGVLGANHPNLVMLQPRRVAARASAQRIAEERGWTLGNEVGYHIRFDRKLTERTRVRIMTEGILTRQLLSDPFLEGVGAVLLDEFHERNLNSDLAIALLKEIQGVRPDLKLVVMSATLEAGPIARFLGDCPILTAEGRTFPVDIRYTMPTPAYRELGDRIAEAVEGILEGSLSLAADPGPRTTDHLLIFLPGVEEIRRTMRRLEPVAARHEALLLPLHGSLGAEEQQRALAPSRQRKIILATNIAETSLTIDGVRVVIDSGYARVARLDAARGLERLDLERISQASATQRAGRAGRTGAGVCLRLWSEKQQHALAAYDVPEIQRVDLAQTLLMLHAWGQSDVRAFGWYEPPPEGTVTAAESLLEMLGALAGAASGSAASGGASLSLTSLGRQMLRLPVHPRLARLLIEAHRLGLGEDGAALAALLSEKDLLLPQPRERAALGTQQAGPSDLLYRLELLQIAERRRFAPGLREEGIDPQAARQVARTRDELLRLTRRLAVPSIPNHHSKIDDLLRLLLLAYPDRVARRRSGDVGAAIAVGGVALRLHGDSIVRHGEFFLALDARHDPRSPVREALVRLASAIEPQWLEEYFPEAVQRVGGVVYDEQQDRVVGRSQWFYRDLLLREERTGAIDPAQAAEALAGAAAPRALAIFRGNEAAARLLDRIGFLRRHMPEHPWPEWEAEGSGEETSRNAEQSISNIQRRTAESSFKVGRSMLDVGCSSSCTSLATLLAFAAAGKRSLDELKRSDLAALLRSALAYPLDRLLDQHAPETLAVPTGNRLKVDYASGRPVLAVRLQELFGQTQTPRVANGRVPVLLHLLAPNYRPVQITDDLTSFWKNTYPQVRKDLRARYPKHAWPEDPLTAPPQAKGRATR